MLAEKTKREILITVAFRVLLASALTVLAIVAIAYLAKMLEFNQSLLITSSVVAGLCGFIFGVYWTMTYLVKSGYSTKK
jgi:accessory gene regulator protein AgrB